MVPILLAVSVVLILFCLQRFITRKSHGNFNSIPGPRSYPLIGTTYLYLPGGPYSWDRLHRAGLVRFRQFGPVVREDLLPGVTILHLFSQEDIKKVFLEEGPHPSRRSHTALLQLRTSQPSLYNSGGLLPTNGPQWARNRNSLQRPVMSATSASHFIPGLEELMLDVVCYISDNIDLLSGRDFLPELEKIFVEATGLITLDTRLEALKTDLDPESLAARIIEAGSKVNCNVLETDSSLWFKIGRFEKRAFRETREGLECLQEIARTFLTSKINSKEEEEEEEEGRGQTLVDSWLSSRDLDINDVATAMEDFLLAGVHTVAYAVSFMMFHLATNREVQARLREECREVLALTGGQITRKTIAAASLASAVMKESLRLNPVAAATGRLLSKDSVFSGYNVPRGTVIVAHTQVASRLEHHFPHPESFKPERWLEGGQGAVNFSCLPFGYGSRSCIGRSLAETQIIIFLIRVFSSFQVEWLGGDLDCETKLINKPDAELLFEFKNI